MSSENCCSRNPIPARVGLALVGFFGFFSVYAIRINMSMAIVCMVNSTGTGGSNNSPSAAPDDDCGELEKDSPSYQGEFDWDKGMQGHILSSFFYGYLVTQVPGGWLAGRYGGKIVFGSGMALATAATLLLPVCARTNVYLVIAMRVLIGIGSGVTFPAMSCLWGIWAPPLERSRLQTLCVSGATLGTIVTLSLSGVLCAVNLNGRDGWPLIFYIFGGLSVIWLVCWALFAYDSPQDHPCIKDKERDYIITSIGTQIHTERKTDSVPWVAIMTSPPVWAILVAQVCNNWGGYMLLTSLPKYMAEVLKFDIQSNGLLSAMPYMVAFVAAICGGQVADCIRERKILSTTNTRKVFQTISFIGQGSFLIGAGFVTCSQRGVAVVLLALAQGCTFGTSSGYNVNHVDIAPRYAGILYGIANTVATVPGIIAPVVVGKLTKNGLREEWLLVFYITGAVLAVGAIVYVLFASGEEQPWAKDNYLIKDSSQTKDEMEGKENPAMEYDTKF